MGKTDGEEDPDGWSKPIGKKGRGKKNRQGSQPDHTNHYGPSHLVRSGVLVKKTRNGKGPRGASFHRPGPFGAAMDAP